MKTRESTATHYVVYRCRSCKRTYRKSFSVVKRSVDNEHPEGSAYEV